MLLPLWKAKIREAVADGRTLREKRVGRLVSLIGIRSGTNEMVIATDLSERQYLAFAGEVSEFWEQCEQRRDAE